MKQSITEKTLTPAELKKREEIVKQLKSEKSSLVKRYGKDAEKVMYGRATNIAKKTAENMNKDKVREMIKKTLMGPIKEDDWKQGDDESDMAKSQLHSIESNTSKLLSKIDDNEQLDAWVQAKLTKAQDYLQSVYDYLCGEEAEMSMDEKKSFPDLTGDGKVTKADILKGRGVNIKEEKPKFFASKANINPELVQKVEDFIREVAQDYDYGVDDAYFAIMQVLKAGLVNEEVNEEEAEAKDAVDTVTMDVPLFIRMLEFAREDAKADVDLHDVTEKAVALNKEKETLSMQDYEDIIPAMEEPMDEGLPKGFWKKETAKLDETFEKLVGKLKKQGKSEKVATAIAGAVSQYKAKGGGKGPTAKQAARLKEETAEGKEWVVWINVDKTGKQSKYILNSKAAAQELSQVMKNKYNGKYDTEVGMMSLSDWNKQYKK